MYMQNLHTAKDKMMNKMKLTFQPNENIEWHCMLFELNLDLVSFYSNSIKFRFLNSIAIELRFHWTQIQV
jgi:hypothetical protein